MAEDFKIKGVYVGVPDTINDTALKLSGPFESLTSLLEALSSALDVVSTFIVDFQNPAKSLFLQLIEEIENLLSAFKEAGIYSIYIPPPINSVNELRSSIIGRSYEVQEAIDEDKRKGFLSDIETYINFDDPHKTVPGGLYRVSKLLKSAFFDQYDDNRPILPESGTKVGGIILVADTPPLLNVDIHAKFFKLLDGLANVLVSIPAESFNAPIEYSVESKEGRVLIKWSDNSSLLPPIKYEILRSEYRSGTPVIEIVETDSGETKEDFVKDKKGNTVFEYDIIGTVDLLEQAADIVNEEFSFEDTTGELGKTYYYSIRKSFSVTKSPSKARTDDTLTGLPGPSKPAKKLSAIVTNEKIETRITYEDYLADVDIPFTNKDFNNIDLSITEDFLDEFSVKGEDFKSVPLNNGRIKINDEIMYYRKFFISSSDQNIGVFSGVLRGREGTLVTSHEPNSIVELLPSFESKRKSTKPDFFPPIKVSSILPPIDEVINRVINILKAISEGFVTASENIDQYIEAIQRFIDNIQKELEEISSIVIDLEDFFISLNFSAIILPVKKENISELTNRISAAFQSPSSPPTSASNIAQAFAIFYAGPQASAVESVINQIFQEV